MMVIVMVVMMWAVGSRERIGWRARAGQDILEGGRSYLSTERQSAHSTELIARAVLMAANFTRRQRPWLAPGRRNPSHSGVDGFCSNALHGLEGGTHRVLAGKRPTHVGLQPLKELVCG